jgi:hypothetical protein
MKKDYHFYHKRSNIYGVSALIFILLAFLPVLFHFFIVSIDITSYVQLGLGMIAFTFYFLCVRCQSKRDNIQRAERRQIKKKEFNEILTLIKEHKDEEAYDALCNYINKYD